MSAPLILLVDNDVDKRILLERFLARQFPANKVISVSNCAAALPLVHAPLPKIVITNGRIAQEDGIEFAQYIAREVCAPVVMISLRHELKSKALDAGVSDFVESYNHQEMREAIARALESVSTGQIEHSVNQSREEGSRFNAV